MFGPNSSVLRKALRRMLRSNAPARTATGRNRFESDRDELRFISFTEGPIDEQPGEPRCARLSCKNM